MNKSLCLRVISLFALSDPLFGECLRAGHGLNHGDEVAGDHICLLLLCSERPLRRLEPLLLRLLLLCRRLRVLSHRTLICVLEVYRLFLRWNVGECLLIDLFIKYGVNSLVDALSGGGLVVLVLGLLQVHDVLEQVLPALVLPA